MVQSDKQASLTADDLKKFVKYDPETGRFIKLSTGEFIGTNVWPGYVMFNIRVGGVRRKYYAHRLAWLYVYGEWPNGLIDHKDGDKSNNRIENLRVGSSAQNAANRPTKRAVAVSRGVMPHGAGFVARLHFKGKRHYLGYHSTLEGAQAAYEGKAKEVHGEFAHVEKQVLPTLVATPEFCGVMGFGV